MKTLNPLKVPFGKATFSRVKNVSYLQWEDAFVPCDRGLMHEWPCRRIRGMPTVLRIGPYRFHFYSRESNEPPHIHVSRDDFEVKFWLRPNSVAFNYGFSPTEVNDIRRLVEENCDFLVEAYHRFHGNR